MCGLVSCSLRCCWSCGAAEGLGGERLLLFLLLGIIYLCVVVDVFGLRGTLVNKGVVRAYGAERPEKWRIGSLLRSVAQRPPCRAKPGSGSSRTHMWST